MQPLHAQRAPPARPRRARAPGSSPTLPSRRRAWRPAPWPVRCGSSRDSTARPWSRSRGSPRRDKGSLDCVFSSRVNAARWPWSNSRSGGSGPPSEISYRPSTAVSTCGPGNFVLTGSSCGRKCSDGCSYQPHRPVAVGQAVGDVDGVLAVDQEDALFQDEAVELVAPDRQAHVQAKFAEIAGAVQLQASGWPIRSRRSGRRSRRAGGASPTRWLSIMVRPCGAGRAAMSRPW